MKFDIVVVDCPWSFSDSLTMSKVKRGAESQYTTLSLDDLKKLDINGITADDSVLVSWVPSALLQEGLDAVKSWGFDFKQTFIWVKVKKKPLDGLYRPLYKWLISVMFNDLGYIPGKNDLRGLCKDFIYNFDLNNVLAFYMGHLFRQTHEIALVATKGRPYNKLKNKSQRSVLFDVNHKHSAKPEGLQDRLDNMFIGNKCELFARRDRPGWHCVGNQSVMTFNEDIRKSISKLKNLGGPLEQKISSLIDNKAIYPSDDECQQALFQLWKSVPYH